MKRLLLLPSLLLILTAHAQTFKKIETTHFKGEQVSSKLIKYTTGKITIGDNFINVEGLKSFTIVRKGPNEPQDEGYTASEYLCISESKTGALKVLKIVLYYTPTKQLCDLIVKNGKTNVDYCLTDK